MKATHALLLAAIALTSSAADFKIGDDVKLVTDTRYIRGYPIDLNPVRYWFRKGKEGQRPLPAWKRFDLIQIKSDLAGKQLCSVKNEAGDMEEILVMNFPAAMKKYMDEINGLKVQVVAMKAEIDLLEPQIRAANAVTPIATGGTLDYVEEKSEQRQRVNLAAANLVTKKENLARTQASLDALIARGTDLGELLLLNAGATWANHPLWDYGQQALPTK